LTKLGTIQAEQCNQTAMDYLRESVFIYGSIEYPMLWSGILRFAQDDSG